MNRPLLAALGCLTLLAPFGCRTAGVTTLRDDRATWRSDELALDRQGGAIRIEVRGRAGEAATVFLLDDAGLARLRDGRDADPVAAACETLRSDGEVVLFTQLPPGTYLVGAFHDLDRDGRHRPASGSEPGSDLLEIELGAGDVRPVTLVIPAGSR